MKLEDNQKKIGGTIDDTVHYFIGYKEYQGNYRSWLSLNDRRLALLSYPAWWKFWSSPELEL